VALKAIVEDINEVDEAFRGEYKEQKTGDKSVFYLDITDFGKHPGAVTLKGSLNKVDKDKKDLETKLNELNAKFGALAEDEGFSVDEWNRLKAGTGETPEAIKSLQDQHKAAIKTLTDKHTAELTAAQGQITQLDGYINNSLVDNGLKDALLDIGVNPDLLDGAVATLRPKVKVTTNDQQERVAVVETDIGEVPVADFVKDWSGDKGKPYISTAKGPDVQGNVNRRTGRVTGDFGGKTNDRVNAIKNKFPELS